MKDLYLKPTTLKAHAILSDTRSIEDISQKLACVGKCLEDELLERMKKERLLHNGALIMPSKFKEHWLDDNCLELTSSVEVLPFDFIGVLPTQVIKEMFNMYLANMNVIILRDGLYPYANCPHKNPRLTAWEDEDYTKQDRNITTVELQPVFGAFKGGVEKELLAFIGVCPVCGEMFVTLPKEE